MLSYFFIKTLAQGPRSDGGGGPGPIGLGPTDGGGDGGRISGRVQAPIPSHPGIKYPVRDPPLTPIICSVDKETCDDGIKRSVPSTTSTIRLHEVARNHHKCCRRLGRTSWEAFLIVEVW